MPDRTVKPPCGGVTRRILLGTAASLAIASAAIARSGPPITLIVPFAAGGPTDIVARLAAEGMARRLDRPIVVENVGGGGGAVGALRAARARPDGTTMVLGQMATHALTPILNPNSGYDPVADFEPIGLVASAPMVLAARKGLPAGHLERFRDHVAANSRQMSFGHAGIGATSHVACELFNSQAGSMAASVAYRGTAPALNDLTSGHIDYMCDQITSIAPLIRSGAVQGVALMASERSPVLPDLPTSAEQGFPDLSVAVWNGLLFPRGAPADVVRTANAALLEALRDGQLATRFEELGASIPAAELNTPEAFRELIAAENARWTPILQRLR